jgi:hypothetical protein
MLKLAESVGALVADITRTPTAAPDAPMTPSRCVSSSAVTLNASPFRRDRAFCVIVERAQLTPRHLARARRIFRGRTELADEYLSFGDSEAEQAAQGEWLEDELEDMLQMREARAARRS